MSNPINKRQYIEDTFKIKMARHLNIEKLYKEFLSLPWISRQLPDRTFEPIVDPTLSVETSLSLLLRQYLFYLRCRDWDVNSSQIEIYQEFVGHTFFSNLWHHREIFSDEIAKKISELIKTFHVEYLQNHRWVVRPEFTFLTLWESSAAWAQPIRDMMRFAKFGLDDLEQIVQLKSPMQAFRALADIRSDKDKTTTPELSWERLLIDFHTNYEPFYALQANDCEPTNYLYECWIKGKEMKIYKSLYVLVYGSELGFEDFHNEE